MHEAQMLGTCCCQSHDHLLRVLLHEHRNLHALLVALHNAMDILLSAMLAAILVVECGHDKRHVCQQCCVFAKQCSIGVAKTILALIEGHSLSGG